MARAATSRDTGPADEMHGHAKESALIISLLFHRHMDDTNQAKQGIMPLVMTFNGRPQQNSISITSLM